MRTLLIALLLIASAAAQSGPAPGYGDPYAYAADYATEQASDATADPAAFVGDHASQEAIAAEAEHTAYIACWTADENGVQNDVCDPYYVPAGEVGAQNQPVAEPVPEPVENGTEETVQATEEFADNVTSAVDEFIDDPTDVTGFVEKIMDATGDFAEKLVAIVSGVGQFVAETVLAAVGGLVMAVGGIGLGLGLLGNATMVGTSTALMAIGTTTIDGVQAFVGGIKASGSFMADAVSAVFGYIGDALAAVGSGIAAGFSAIGAGISATAQAISDAAQAVVSAIADAASSIKETIGGWLGGVDAQLPDTDGLTKQIPVDDGGLVDGVLEIVE